MSSRARIRSAFGLAAVPLAGLVVFAMDPAQDPVGTLAAPAAASAPATPASAPATLAAIRPAGKYRLPLDLSYVDRRSPAFARFRNWVDEAVRGHPGFSFSAVDAAMMARLDGNERYCELAVSTVESQVSNAETAIRLGQAPEIAGNSYLYAGPMIADLAFTLDTCPENIDDARRARWSRYAEQTLHNLWHPDQARWGDREHAWSGWSVDNPGNNYHYSFLTATATWALAADQRQWQDELRQRLFPDLIAYFRDMPGGGSREGTGYGESHMHLFALYRLWHEATSEDLAGASPHAADSIPYWIHATVPTLDRYAPIGDQARYPVPDLYDYQRRIMLEARALSRDEALRDQASWWLNHVSVRHMASDFNTFADLLPAGQGGRPPEALVYHARGAGHLFARTGWDRNAMWVGVVAGRYDESHAHQDQGGFMLYAGDWLAVTSNIHSRSGINQGTQFHNVLRFESPVPLPRQCQAPENERIIHQCAPSTSDLQVTPGSGGTFTARADLTPAYAADFGVKQWIREFEFGERRLVVRDAYRVDSGVDAVFQINVPARPVLKGQEASAGRLKIRVIEPAQARVSVHDWRQEPESQFHGGWRIDIAGGQGRYVVELSDR